MRLEARIRTVNEHTQRYIDVRTSAGTVVRITRLEIEETEGGYYLFGYDDEDPRSQCDHWYPELEETMRQARWMYHINPEDWTVIEP